jgi:hypothetical protein
MSTEPDPFVHGGRQNDTELIEALQRWEELHRKWEDDPSDDEGERLSAEQSRLMEFINNAQPASLLGCIIKLRVLADPIIGMEVGDRDDDVVSVRQVLAFLEGLTRGAP